MKLRRVVVTGLGSLTPIGNNITDFWSSLISGKSGADRITHFDPEKFKTQFACELKNFNPLDTIEKKELRKYDNYTIYALVSVAEAIQSSGINLNEIDKDRAGVIWGSGIGGIKTFSDEITTFVKGNENPRFSPFFIPKMIADIAAGIISIKYGFRGPNFATVSACASSSHAIIDALNYIRLGKANLFICGGSEASIHPAGVGGFNALRALSTNNTNPKLASRPFDVNRDGFVLGEGAGALILEDYEHAINRNAKIYAEVIGGGMSADAYHITAPHPEGQGAVSVMNNSLLDAGINSNEIDYINVHGTSTPLGDISEIKAIKKVFKNNIYDLNISSTKSMTGHLLGAAGAIESITCILSLKNGIIPPTINLENLDPELDDKINYTANQAQTKNITYALCNTFGFGGHNASIIYKKSLS
tara:strand:+ start:256 stop:1509 length:1254 start_codon:yes stop_codon:yes gene_type:complete